MSAPVITTLRRDQEAARTFAWRVELRDLKTGQLVPVMVEAGPEYLAISGALNKAARFFPGRNFKPATARRTL